MSENERFHIRLHLTQEFADMANDYGMDIVALAPLTDILDKFNVVAESEMKKILDSVDDMPQEEIDQALKMNAEERSQFSTHTAAYIVHGDDIVARAWRRMCSRSFMLEKAGNNTFTATHEVQDMIDELVKAEGQGILDKVKTSPAAPGPA